jgi:hypothetical protein
MGFSLPHWLAFWAVGGLRISSYPKPSSIVLGFKWFLIDYASKIETLFAKMEGIRTTILPPNRDAFDQYFMPIWFNVHTITAAVSSLSSELDCPEKFKLYHDLEEARLEKNLRAADYIIDGIDTLTQITGRGRIEKVRTTD